MTSEKLMKLLNETIAREIQVSIQYIWQHVLAKGIESAAVEDIFKKIAITEMKHAEEVAERLAYLGGTPTKAYTHLRRWQSEGNASNRRKG